MAAWLLTTFLLLIFKSKVVELFQFANVFPSNFSFGAATAAFQVEGGWDADGKGTNIWDLVTHEHPELVDDRANSDEAAWSYYKFREDIQALKSMGMQFYRFSISWTRIMPNGLPNNINKKGIAYYNAVINDVLKLGIVPVVTMYHFDLPQYLQALGGWANKIVVQCFFDYARLLFTNFGDRVKWWLTINEPTIISAGYEGQANHLFAPVVNTPGIGSYLAGYNLLMAHARAYHLYKREFKSWQGGKISMAFHTFWYEPYDPHSYYDHMAAERALQFNIGWFAHPIFTREGDYPQVMKNRIKHMSLSEGFSYSRLPLFTKDEIEYIKGTADFLGLNYYTAYFARPNDTGPDPSMLRDTGVEAIRPPRIPQSPSSEWLSIAPIGLRKLLNWIKENYGNIDVLITENGYADNGATVDDMRMIYIGTHLLEILKAIFLDGVKVLGYTVWSLIDAYEWFGGYTTKFGLFYVNFTDPARHRIPKSSAYFMKNIIETRSIPTEFYQYDNELSASMELRV